MHILHLLLDIPAISQGYPRYVAELIEPSLRNGPMLKRVNKYPLSQGEKDKQKQKKP